MTSGPDESEVPHRAAPERLRFLTYLAPGIPLPLFATVVELVGRALGPVSLASLTKRSGPVPDDNPFADPAPSADVGFVCAPSYVLLDRGRPSPTVELLGAAPVYDAPENGGRPVYHAEVVVKADSGQRQSLTDLRGARFAFNDDCSLSGYFSVLERLAEMGAGPDFFTAIVCSGSHQASLEMVAEGHADCAAIDAFALRAARQSGNPAALAVRTLETLGPFAVQPVVVRSGLPDPTKASLRTALLGLHELHAERLLEVGLVRFAPVDDSHYDRQRRLLADL